MASVFRLYLVYVLIGSIQQIRAMAKWWHWVKLLVLTLLVDCIMTLLHCFLPFLPCFAHFLFQHLNWLLSNILLAAFPTHMSVSHPRYWLVRRWFHLTIYFIGAILLCAIYRCYILHVLLRHFEWLQVGCSTHICHLHRAGEISSLLRDQSSI